MAESLRSKERSANLSMDVIVTKCSELILESKKDDEERIRSWIRQDMEAINTSFQQQLVEMIASKFDCPTGTFTPDDHRPRLQQFHRANRVHQYFDYHDIPENQKVKLASIHLDGPACSWFQWKFHSNQCNTWTKFVNGIQIRFGSSRYEDLKGALSKLVQETTVLDYQVKFESLSSRIYGLSDDMLKSCFISGLKPMLRREVLALQPDSLQQALDLARLQEDKFLDFKPYAKP
ncbi:uncharacterized protein LOC122663013 [Telopea speciosissima]|uniref:uncharacterized protein LOC122663013 n=1 Tax=Telopea speciosissima TaxID=54955 RepID=UPI001CC49373|nr:uncharacterized protein LOC122663013 [Telopea speciosissima]